MTLRGFDLNLLVVLEAVLRERSVSKAAARLGMSQSAVSHALARLRISLSDPLLFRKDGVMEPTWRARAISETVRGALAQIEALLNTAAPFDPAGAQRAFVLRASDYVAAMLLPSLCPALRAEAPGIGLDVQHFPARPDDAAAVPGEVHLRLASDPAALRARHRQRLVDDGFVVVMRRGHPAAQNAMTLETYLGLAHIKLAPGAAGGASIDEALARRGVVRQVALQVASWPDVAAIVGNTDLTIAMPRHWWNRSGLVAACTAMPLPLDEVRFAVDMVWHARDEADPAQQWLRSLVARQFPAPDPA